MKEVYVLWRGELGYDNDYIVDIISVHPTEKGAKDYMKEVRAQRPRWDMSSYDIETVYFHEEDTTQASQ